MNKYLLLFILFFFSTMSFCQITIGTGTNEAQEAPIEAYYGYSYSQSIYLQTDINAAGSITTLSYFYSGTSSLTNSDDLVDIWIGHTTKSAFAGTTDWEDVTGLTQVFSGSLPAPTSPGTDEWLEIDITDFVYNNTDNLVIAVDANEDGYDSFGDDFHNTASPGAQTIKYRSDSTNPDPSAPPTGSTVSYIPNIILGGIVPSCSAATNAAASSITGTTATITWDDGIGCLVGHSISFSPADDAGGMVACGTGFYNATGLNSGTTYTVSVLNDCGTTATTFDFTTPFDYCGGDQFLDSGGAAGSYDDNENLSWTICPDNPTDKVTITFTEFELEGAGSGSCYDELRIYDGPDNSATELSPANGYCFQSVTDGTSYPGGGLGVPITSTDASGCLHFNFTSDVSGQFGGWVADVTCAPYVDPATIVTLAPAGTSMMTADDATIGANNYTYYEDPANAGNYLFAVNWDASGNGHNDASDVTITVDNAPADGTADDGGDNATWTMKRFWNVDMGAGVLVDPVDVKFFYDGAEKTATENSAISDGRPVEPSAWFKTATGPWANVPGAGNPAIDVIELTDANAGAGTMENGVVYAEFNGVASFSGGSFASGVGPAASSLPLELLEWKGESMKKANKLMWKTTNEQNTANFFVEKLHNQNDWRPIGELAAAGNSSSILDYSILDESPSSIELYRLKSMDIDGQYTYSQVIEIRRTLTDNVIEAFPNPFNDQIQVQLNLTTGQQGNISIFDVNGKLISSQKRSLEEGSNSILINLEDQSTGIYLISVQLNDSILQKRIIKQ